MRDERPVLIAAISGRALAASARAGGFAPLVVDFFGDQDTLAAAAGHRRLDGGFARGMQSAALFTALTELARGQTPIGLVWGTGFEDRTNLLAEIARRWPLLGNNAVAVERLKDPVTFAQICRDCDIPHPEVSLAAPIERDGWLMKRRGGSGGGHVANAASELPEDYYFQRRVPGVAVSALFLAAQGRACVLGLSRQWHAPAPRQKLRYGGAVTPADISPPMAARLDEAVQRMAEATRLVGLNSADFLLEGDNFSLLEINPRPGATLDIFAPEDAAEPSSLFALHVRACAGELPKAPPRFARARAAAIVYADEAIPHVPDIAWPDWTADRPLAGSAIDADAPLCSVLASAPTPAKARRLVGEHSGRILSLFARRAA